MERWLRSQSASRASKLTKATRVISRIGLPGRQRTKRTGVAAVVVTLTENCPGVFALTWTDGGEVAGVVVMVQSLRVTESLQERLTEPEYPCCESTVSE